MNWLYHIFSQPIPILHLKCSWLLSVNAPVIVDLVMCLSLACINVFQGFKSDIRLSCL